MKDLIINKKFVPYFAVLGIPKSMSQEPVFGFILIGMLLIWPFHDSDVTFCPGRELKGIPRIGQFDCSLKFSLKITNGFMAWCYTNEFSKSVSKQVCKTYTLQIHTAERQWKCSETTVILKKYSGLPHTVNVLSAKSTDECLRTKSQDN